MARKNQHALPHPQGVWQVKGSGNSRATVRTNTQKEAVTIAKQIARSQHSECFTHGKNRQIRTRDSYGNDPFPPRG